jgi:hypothetical protein
MYWFSLLPLNYSESFVSLFIVFALCFALRYPHEYAHWLAGKVQGIDSAINFRRLNATCTPVREISAKEMIIFALAPFVLLGIPLVVLSVIPFASEFALVFRGVLVYHLFACYFDYVYTFYAVKYKRSRFVDSGLGLEIQQ